MKNNKGFTLIELSIVLVVVGLIIGGVLVGKDLIDFYHSEDQAAGSASRKNFQEEPARDYN